MGGNQTAYDIAIQNGKLVVAGISYTGGYDTPIDASIALARYNADGSLDLTFGTGGIVTTKIAGNTDNGAHALVIQPDDSIVVAGSTGDGISSQFALARYDADGNLDLSFGAGGIVTTPVGSDAAAFDLALQGGKLVAAGYSNSGGSYVFTLARYETDGNLDSTFGAGGVVTTPIGTNDIIHAVAIQSNKIVAAGETFNGIDRNFALARYETDGTLDTTFNPMGSLPGTVTTDIAFFDDAAFALDIQGNGKLVAAGSTDTGSPQYEFALIRYNTDGSLDSTFGAAGIVATPIRTVHDEARAVAIQPNGKIVVAGYSYTGVPDPDLPETFDMAVARYDANGSLDSTFGNGGITTTAVGSGSNFARAVIIQDGKAVVAGEAKENGADYDFAAVRYLP
jgi:uncharacterized delta-60 repeat protein